MSEEAGVAARIDGLVGRASFKTDREPVIAKFYLMEKIGDVPTKEKRKPRWFSVGDALEELKYEESQSLLRMAEQRRWSDMFAALRQISLSPPPPQLLAGIPAANEIDPMRSKCQHR